MRYVQNGSYLGTRIAQLKINRSLVQLRIGNDISLLSTYFNELYI